MAITNPTADRQLVEAVADVDRLQQRLSMMSTQHPDQSVRERCYRMEVALRAVSKMGEVDADDTTHTKYIKGNLNQAVARLGLEVTDKPLHPNLR